MTPSHSDSEELPDSDMPSGSLGPAQPEHTYKILQSKTEEISQNIDYCVNYSVGDAVQRTPLKLAIGGQHVLASKILIEFDPSSPFDLTVLNLAKTPAMKNMLTDLFQNTWNMTLFLPML